MNKGSTFILVILLFCACRTQHADQGNKKSNHNFDFIIGAWKRTNEKEGKETFEIWSKTNDSTYVGTGFTLKDKDTIWKENVILSPINKKWYYQVSDSKKIVTNFALIKSTSTFFTCENQQNDFPKKIIYKKKNDHFFAEISDAKVKIDFVFAPLHK